MATTIMAIIAKNGHFDRYGYGHFYVKHDIVWYPLKELLKTKSVVKRSAQKD